MSRRLDQILDASVVASFDRRGYERHAACFAADECSDWRGRRLLITGGTSGIGRALAEQMAARGADITLWGRRPDVGEQAVAALVQAGGRARFQSVDLGDLDAVTQASATLQGSRWDGVVLNAGAMPLERCLTAQDHELIWASQVLGHLLLLRRLRAAGVLGEQTRVVWVSSGGMYLAPLDLSDLRCNHRYDRHSVYANAKRAQVVLASWLAAEWPDVWQASMHPGWVDTAAVQYSMPWFYRFFRKNLRTPGQGADTIEWLLTRREAPESGQFWFDRCPKGTEVFPWTRTSDKARDRLVSGVMASTDPWMRGV